MLNKEIKWLAEFEWQKVVDINREICQKEGVVYKEGKGYQEARQLWEQNIGEPRKLLDMLDFCKRLSNLEPFDFLNNNTFAEVSRCFIKNCLNNAPKLPLTMLMTTASHYIVGIVKRRELIDVISYFEYATGNGEFKPVINDKETVVQQSETANSQPRQSHATRMPVR